MSSKSRSIIFQKQTNRKRDQIYGYGQREWEVGKLDESSQKVETFGYKY